MGFYKRMKTEKIGVIGHPRSNLVQSYEVGHLEPRGQRASNVGASFSKSNFGVGVMEIRHHDCIIARNAQKHASLARP